MSGTFQNRGVFDVGEKNTSHMLAHIKRGTDSYLPLAVKMLEKDELHIADHGTLGTHRKIRHFRR
jgi:hypothetical protein